MRSPISPSSARCSFLAAEPLTDKIVWDSGNKYTFRLRASTYMQTAMLVPEAAKLGKKRWAIVYPNYEYGQSATAAFKKQMIGAAVGRASNSSSRRCRSARSKPGPVVQALLDAQPDAIFSSLFGPDLARFVREGQLRGLFKDRPVFNLLGGEPEYLDPLKDEAPVGWCVTGYPWYAIDTPEHKRFRDAYQAKFNDYPRLGSVVGYSAVKAAAAALRSAGSTDTDKLVAAMQDLRVDSPFGAVTFRALDHQSTMGAYVGRTAVQGRQGRDGRLALRRRQGLPAARRRRAAAAAGGLMHAATPPRPRRRVAQHALAPCLRVPRRPAAERPRRRVVAVPRRRRTDADLRRHAHRQLRARLAVHARRVRRVLGGSALGAYADAPLGFWGGAARRDRSRAASAR